MTLTASNLVLPGPAKVYVGTAGAAVPVDSVAKGTAWGGSWVEVGLTLGGAQATFGHENVEAMSDQYNAAVAAMIVQQSVTITFAAAETTLTNLKQALGYGTLTAGSTESTFGVGGNETFVTPYAIGLESFAPGATSSSAKYSRLVIWKAIQADEVEMSFKKDDQRVYQYSMKGLVDTSQSSAEALWKLIERQV